MEDYNKREDKTDKDEMGSKQKEIMTRKNFVEMAYAAIDPKKDSKLNTNQKIKPLPKQKKNV